MMLSSFYEYNPPHLGGFLFASGPGAEMKSVFLLFNFFRDDYSSLQSLQKRDREYGPYHKGNAAGYA